MSECVCVIPARGGSKRIKKKNMKDFLGKPILWYSLQSAKQSGIFSSIIVSSDDEEILDFAQSQGVVAYQRSKELSLDWVGSREVIVDAIEHFYLKEWVCCLYATAPLLRACRLKEAFEQRDHSLYLMAVGAYESNPYRSFRIEQGRNKMLFSHCFKKQSQELEMLYHDAGQFYFARSEVWQREANIFEHSKSFILPQSEIQDIDEMWHWQLAKMKYKLLNGKGDEELGE